MQLLSRRGESRPCMRIETCTPYAPQHTPCASRLFSKALRSGWPQKWWQNEAFPAVKAETSFGRKGRVTRILLRACFRLHGRRYFVTWPNCQKSGLSLSLFLMALFTRTRQPIRLFVCPLVASFFPVQFAGEDVETSRAFSTGPYVQADLLLFKDEVLLAWKFISLSVRET